MGNSRERFLRKLDAGRREILSGFVLIPNLWDYLGVMKSGGTGGTNTKSGLYFEGRTDLIEAIKRHHPEKDVTPETDVWIYTYEFSPADKKGKEKK